MLNFKQDGIATESWGMKGLTRTDQVNMILAVEWKTGWKWKKKNEKKSGLSRNRIPAFAMTGRNALSNELIEPIGEQAILRS